MSWVDELDLHVGPPEAAMGTRALDPSRWLLVDDEWIGQRDEARALLRARRRDVLAGRAHDAAAAALDAAAAGWLLTYRPDLVDDGPDDVDALARARQRVAEDLCLLVPAGDTWVLGAGCVCFPSYWRLGEKLGRPLPAVHDPVPGYPGRLAARVDVFLGRLQPGQGVWRRNWSIHPTAALHAPVHERSALPPPEDRWLRSEYQTLVRLDGVDAVAFTIRTQQIRLADLAGRPDRCAAVAAAVAGWTDAQRAYKGAAVDAALVRWLDSR